MTKAKYCKIRSLNIHMDCSIYKHRYEYDWCKHACKYDTRADYFNHIYIYAYIIDSLGLFV